MKCKIIVLLLVVGSLTITADVPKQIPAAQFTKPAEKPNVPAATPTATAPNNVIMPFIKPELLFTIIGKPEYRHDVLPHDFSHLISLLQYAKTTPQPRSYSSLSLQLFSKLAKGCPMVNAYMIESFLKDFNTIIQPCFTIKYPQQYHWLNGTSLNQLNSFDRLHSIINPLLYNRFNNDFDQFKENPTNFLDNLAQECILLVRQEITIQQLRTMVVRFLENVLGKLVWSPEDGIAVWTNVKTIAQHLHYAADHGILDDDNDLDDLLWSLIHRFCYFIDLTANDLQQTVLDKIKEELDSPDLLLCSLEEQEAFLETKKSYLTSALATVHAKRQAYQNGILIS